MKFIWRDYDTTDKTVIENWLDEEARFYTGIDGSFEDVYRYWLSESDISSENKIWCKVIFQANEPVAVLLMGVSSPMHIGCNEYDYTVSELIVAPGLRGKGIGTAVLKELIKHDIDILGKEILSAKAVIFPNNIASKRVFERAGFIYEFTHPDADAEYYIYRKDKKLC